MTVYFTLIFCFCFWLRLRLDVLLSGGSGPLLAPVISVSQLVWTVGFVRVSMPLWSIVSEWRIRVCLREVCRLLVAARTRIVRVSVMPVRRLRVSGGNSVSLFWELPAVWGISGRGVDGVALAGRVEAGSVSGVTPTRRGRVERRVWRGMTRGLRRGEADGGCFLVEGQRAVAVLAWENRRGAAVTRLIGRLALDGHVRLAPAWVVGFEEGAVNKTLSDCKTRTEIDLLSIIIFSNVRITSKNVALHQGLQT